MPKEVERNITTLFTTKMGVTSCIIAFFKESPDLLYHYLPVLTLPLFSFYHYLQSRGIVH